MQGQILDPQELSAVPENTSATPQGSKSMDNQRVSTPTTLDLVDSSGYSDGSSEDSSSEDQGIVEFIPTGNGTFTLPPSIHFKAGNLAKKSTDQDSPRKVTVVGSGYVGLPLAVLMKDCNHEVTAFDVNAEVVQSLQKGVSTVDDVENEDLEGIHFTYTPSDMKESNVFVICVPTPVTEEKLPDLKYIKAVKESLMENAQPGSLIILESTVGVGDTRRTFSDVSRWLS